MKIYISEILKATNGRLIGNNYLEEIFVTNVSIDSRYIEQGGLFVPNITEKFDGHDYIAKAFENGAIATFISKELNKYDNSKYYILVNNIKEAFHNLARYNRDKYDISVIGITGSVGKTTAKEMIATVLSQRYNVLKTKGNFNSELGLPQMLLEMNETHDIAVLEIGIDHVGEMELQEKMARPTDAVITNIDISHLEHFKTKDNTLKEKINIFRNIKQKENILLNIDDDMLKTINKNKVMWYGENKNADIIADKISIKNNEIRTNIRYKDKTINICIPGISKHLIYPALIAAYFGKKFNLNDEEIKSGISKYKTLEKRMDIQKLCNNITIIDDTYNANPSSMKSAIDALTLLEGKNKIAILGDMLELGDAERITHKEIGTYLIDKNINIVVAVGENMKYMYEELSKVKKDKQIYYYSNKKNLFDNLQKIILKDSIILLKASRGMAFEEIIDKIKEVGVHL